MPNRIRHKSPRLPITPPIIIPVLLEFLLAGGLLEIMVGTVIEEDRVMLVDTGAEFVVDIEVVVGLIVVDVAELEEESVSLSVFAVAEFEKEDASLSSIATALVESDDIPFLLVVVSIVDVDEV